jgi:hypothetical protein
MVCVNPAMEGLEWAGQAGWCRKKIKMWCTPPTTQNESGGVAHSMKCINCQVQLSAVRSTKKFCSVRCRVATFRKVSVTGIATTKVLSVTQSPVKRVSVTKPNITAPPKPLIVTKDRTAKFIVTPFTICTKHKVYMMSCRCT